MYKAIRLFREFHKNERAIKFSVLDPLPFPFLLEIEETKNKTKNKKKTDTNTRKKKQIQTPFLLVNQHDIPVMNTKTYC